MIDRRKLLSRALMAFAAGAVILMLLIFLPAGTLRYFGGWLLTGILFVPMLAMGLVMYVKAPELLGKRLSAKEREQDQQLVVKLSGGMFLLGFVIAGLDFRFGWLPLPKWVQIAAAVIFLIGYALYAEVLRENAYLSRTVEVQQGQKVIDTGLYGIVRHPMYLATLLMFTAVPLVLGSVAALPVFLIYPALMVLRIRNEEQVLREGLRGYAAYCDKVKYRLIPFIW